AMKELVAELVALVEGRKGDRRSKIEEGRKKAAWVTVHRKRPSGHPEAEAGMCPEGHPTSIPKSIDSMRPAS
ncbi:MAG: hypothetical protein ACUVS3_16870, partial [Thermodesulfobacteriota bacterium]